MRRHVVFLFTAVLALAIGGSGWAGEPARGIPYSGSLEVDGQRPNASFNMKFELFNESGTSVWDDTMAVPVTGGAFAVVLGNTKPLEDKVFTAGALYLEVTIDPSGSKTVLSPRQQIFAAPQALRARLAAEAFSTYGDIWMPNDTYVRGLGRLHLKSEELLYLLAKTGVFITGDQGSAGTLWVQNGLTAGSVGTNSATVNGVLSAGSVTIGDLSLASAGGGLGPHIQAGNSSGHLFIDNRPTASDGRLFLNYNVEKTVTFGKEKAHVDAANGDISTQGTVTAKGAIKAHSDVVTRCFRQVDACGVELNVTCPTNTYLKGIYWRSNCLTATCCYIGE